MLTQLLYQGYYMQGYHWPESDLLLPYKLHDGSQKGSVAKLLSHIHQYRIVLKQTGELTNYRKSHDFTKHTITSTSSAPKREKQKLFKNAQENYRPE